MFGGKGALDKSIDIAGAGNGYTSLHFLNEAIQQLQQLHDPNARNK
jgi:hypothetical protein